MATRKATRLDTGGPADVSTYVETQKLRENDGSAFDSLMAAMEDETVTAHVGDVPGGGKRFSTSAKDSVRAR